MAAVLGQYLSLVGFDFAGVGNVGTRALSASSTKQGWVFQALADATITKVLVVGSSLAGTSPSYKVGLQGVTSTFTPDGTYLGGGSPASHVQLLASGANEITLDNPLAITRGTFYALVVEYDTGTINGSNAITLRTGFSTFYQSAPYSLGNTGSWAKDTTTQPAFFGLYDGTSWYGRPCLNASSLLVTSANHICALKFTLPSGAGTSFQVIGLRVMGRPVVSATDVFRMGIWNAAGSELQGVDLDADYDANAGSQYYPRRLIFSGTLATLSFGTTYYIGFKRTGSVSTGFDTMNFNVSAHRDALNHGLTAMATWNGSAWSDNNTQLPLVADLILSDVTASAGGGLMRHPGTFAGFNG